MHTNCSFDLHLENNNLNLFTVDSFDTQIGQTQCILGLNDVNIRVNDSKTIPIPTYLNQCKP